MSASSAKKRPSPWEMGTEYISPAEVSESQGDLFEATRTRTMRDWWRAMVL